MPYRRRTFRRRRKRTYRRKWSRKRTSRKFTNDGKRFFKLRVSQDISSDAGGVINLQYSDNPTVYQDWTSIAALFDSYRVCAIKIQFVPYMPNDTSTVTGYHPLYVVHDPDSVTPTSASVNAFIQYENMKIKNMYRPWTYYRRMAKQTSSGNVIGQAAPVMLVGGYKDVAQANSSQAIQLYGEGFDISQSYGRLIVTQYIVAKNRR